MDLPLRIVWTIGALLFGLSVGSFVNVLIFRLPRERSIVYPRSHCFCCGTELRGRDLVPVLSYLLGGGRCRYCGVLLSSQYAWIEALCGLLFAALVWRWGLSLPAVAYCVVAAALLAALVTDLRHKIIPSALNAAVFWTALLASVAGAVLQHVAPDAAAAARGSGWLPSPTQALAGAAVGYLVFEGIVRVGRVVFGQEAMGGGDVLLVAALGALFGPTRLLGTMCLLAFVSGAVVGVALLATRVLNRRQPLAFGPFLIFGALTVMLWPEVATWVAQRYHLA